MTTYTTIIYYCLIVNYHINMTPCILCNSAITKQTDKAIE